MRWLARGALWPAHAHEAMWAVGIGGALGLLTLLAPLAGLGALAVAAFGLVALARPLILCHFVIISTALTSGMERGELIPLFRPNELLLAATSGLALLVVALDRGRQLAPARYAAGLAAFMCLFLGTSFLPALVYSLRMASFGATEILGLASMVQYGLIFLLFAVIPASDQGRRGLLLGMVWGGALVAVVGLLQAAQIGPVNGLLDTWYASNHGDQARAANRVTSLLGAWNALGMFLMASVLIGWVALPHLSRPIVRLGVLAAIGVCASCMLASGSFAATITLALGLVMVELLAGRSTQLWSKLIWFAVACAVLALALQPLVGPLVEQRLSDQFGQPGWSRGAVPATLNYRFWVWHDVFWPHIRTDWLWGAYLEVPRWFDWQYEESQYVMLLFRYGLVGLSFYMLWVGIMLVWLQRRIRRRVGLGRDIAIVAFTLLILLSIAGLTNAVMSYSGVAEYMWVLFALVASSSDKDATI